MEPAEGTIRRVLRFPDPVTSEATGVVYAPQDYVSTPRRLLIDAVDMVTALAAGAIVVWLVNVLFSPGDAIFGIALLIFAAVWFVYFVLLKRSRMRTVGYAVAGARIVNLRGERPGIGALTLRLMFVVAGPVNFLVDLVWISGDANRQALRDKFAHTYVIRAGAVPAGSGRVVYRTYTVFGATMLFQEVEPAAAPAA